MSVRLRFVLLACWLVVSGVPCSIHAQTLPGFVAPWGITNSATTNLPAASTSVLSASAGGFHGVAVLTDRSVIAWGDNSSVQTNIPATATNIISISAGSKHTLAVRSNGTVVAWGFNQNAQTNVPSGLNGVIAVAAGSDHSVALRTNGTVIVWGGALFTLTNIPATATNVKAIAAGSTATLALRGDGTVVAWGTVAAQTNLPASLTNISAVSVGANFCMALRSNGTVVAWGDNGFGQATAPTNLNGVTAISAGWYHALALRTNGSIVAWGLANSGQTTVPTSLTNATQISAGNAFNYAVNPAPVIQSRPPAVTTLAPGQSTTLSLTLLSGSAYTVQWFLNGSPLAGETNLDLVVNSFSAAKAGRYVATISNLFSSTSAAANLRLSNAPVVFVSGEDVGGGPVTRTNSAVVTISAASGLYPNIYYTLDGSTPSFTGFAYSGAFTLSNSATLRAVAYNSLFSDSAVSPTINLQVIPTYPLTVTAPGGSISAVPSANIGANLYLSNTLVTVTATPSNGWTFLHWAGDSTSTSAVINVTMDGPRTLQAVFGTTLNLLTVGDGYLVLDPPSGPYPHGSTVTLTALPFPGSYFFGWAGVIGGSVNPVTITATNASGITALFGALQSNQVSLVVQPVGGGSATVSPAKNVYTNGEAVTISAIGTSNRVFAAWSGNASGSVNPLQLTMNSSKLIYANFVPGTPTNGPVFTMTPGGRSLNRGDSTLLSATATGDGPLVYQWRLNGSVIPGATNSTLELTNALPAQAGIYDVVASGAAGATTSPVAPVALFGIQLATTPGQPLPLLTIDCAPGAAFTLERLNDLASTNWMPLASWTMNSAQSFFVDSTATNPVQRFYRLRPE